MELEEMSTTTIFLSQDIFMEILSWLPAKSLINSFKFVCKDWNTIIKDHNFIKMHLNRGGGGAINGSLVRKERSGNTIFQLHPPFNFEAKKMDIDSNLLILKSRLVASFNGLLCLSVNDERIILLNPSTRKYKVSPKEVIGRHVAFGLTISIYGFGCYYNSTIGIDEYKVIRIPYYSLFDDPKKFQIDIYSMSSNSWRRWRGVEDIPCGRFQERSGVFLNEAFHWMGCKVGGYAWDTLVSFSIRDEEFREMQLPPCAYAIVKKDCYPYIRKDDGINLINVRGCLGKVYFSRTEMMDIELEMWVMKEYGIGESWTKELVIKSSDSDPPRILSAYQICTRTMTCFLAGDQIIIEGRVFFANQPPWFNNDLNFQTKGWAREYGRRILYNMNKKKIDGEFRMFDMPDKHYRDDQVHHIETLVSLKSSNNRKIKDTESLRN